MSTTYDPDQWAGDVDLEPEQDHDYLDDDLPGRPLRKRIGKSTLVLLSLALIAGAFYAGVRVEKGQVKSSSGSGASALAALASRFRNAATTGTGNTGGANPLAALAGGGQGVSGSITLIDGNNIYITLNDGSIVKAVVSAGSQITVTSTGTIQSMHPGDNVTVQGATDSDGSVTATSIRDTGAVAGGGGGGGGRRAAGGTAGGTGGGTAATGGGGAATATPGG